MENSMADDEPSTGPFRGAPTPMFTHHGQKALENSEIMTMQAHPKPYLTRKVT